MSEFMVSRTGTKHIVDGGGMFVKMTGRIQMLCGFSINKDEAGPDDAGWNECIFCMAVKKQRDAHLANPVPVGVPRLVTKP